MAHIYSPLPGTFYRSSSPAEPPFKADGDAVAVGDVVGLIEVMKSFHEVRSEVAGKNVRFECDNEEPVMAGAVLAQVD
jgi:acetyl-CoA carboxylase biotin carboxyl carrier protein